MKRFHIKAFAGKSSRPGDIVGTFVCVRATTDDPSATSPDWLPSIVHDSNEPGPPGPVGDRGPVGERGARGSDGRDGIDGASLNPHGEYHYGEPYHRGDIVRDDDASYVCLAAETKAAPSPVSKSWMLLAKDGDSIVGPAGRGPRGLDGTGAVTDVEMVFEESTIAGQVVRASGDGKCSISNGLSYYTCLQTIGVAVVNTQAGHRGKVRTIGPIKRNNWTPLIGETCLRPGGYYALSGLGMLSRDACNVAVHISIGLAITADTLLISQNFSYGKPTDDLKAPCLSTLLKGSPVRLATADNVDVASMPDNWKVAGVLMDDVTASNEATYRRDTTITRDDWSSLLESSDTLLVPNQAYYLSDVPGKFTTNDTNRLFIGKAKDTKSLKVSVGDSTPNHLLSV